jgi:hypothetical protein
MPEYWQSVAHRRDASSAHWLLQCWRHRGRQGAIHMHTAAQTLTSCRLKSRATSLSTSLACRCARRSASVKCEPHPPMVDGLGRRDQSRPSLAAKCRITVVAQVYPGALLCRLRVVCPTSLIALPVCQSCRVVVGCAVLSWQSWNAEVGSKQRQLFFLRLGCSR